MTLTKDERFTAYCIMLAEAENATESDYTSYYGVTSEGFCFMIYAICEYRHGGVAQNNLMLLPELLKRMPKKKYSSSGVWFSVDKEGWQKRIELLKQCINETHP